jgi:hypothetical protein
VYVNMSHTNDALTQMPSHVIQDVTVQCRDGVIRGRAQLIGYGSSRVEHHRDHVDGGHEFASKNERCSACRWNEVRIFKFTSITELSPLKHMQSLHSISQPYLVHTLGLSIVPNEFTKCRTLWVSGGYEIVEVLTVRPRDGDVFLPGPAARALARAAELDESIRRAYVDRAVA